MIKIAVVGLGMIGQQMLPVLKEMPEYEIVALCGTDRSKDSIQQLQEQYQVEKVYSNYSKMLRDKHFDADLIYLAVPNHMHYVMAKEAVEHNFHVFVEKPFVLSYEHAKELVSMARERHLIVLEAISNQYLPIFGQIKEALPRVGTIRQVTMNFSQYSSRFDKFLAGEYVRVFDPEIGGGALLDINIYNLHLAVGLFGVPSDGIYFANQMRGVDTSGSVVLRYPDFICTCIGAKDAQGPSVLLIEGTKGYLVIKAPTNTLQAALEFYDNSSKEVEILYQPDVNVHRMVYEFRELARMIQERDWEGCRMRQQESLRVCKLAERLRLNQNTETNFFH